MNRTIDEVRMRRFENREISLWQAIGEGIGIAVMFAAVLALAWI